LAPYLGEKGDKEPDPEFSGSAWVREAQRKVSLRVPKTGMAVITDVGEMYVIHPPRMKEVGDRLALAAQKVAYGESVDGSGPIYQSMKVTGDKAVVTFTNTNGGLQAKEGGPVTGFLIKGENGTFVPADAVIKGDTVEVSSKDVKMPTAVRFGWADYPIVNLWGSGANPLPASPFATDK
jgi:sialate O-acetylesterase